MGKYFCVGGVAKRGFHGEDAIQRRIRIEACRVQILVLAAVSLDL